MGHSTYIGALGRAAGGERLPGDAWGGNNTTNDNHTNHNNTDTTTTNHNDNNNNATNTTDNTNNHNAPPRCSPARPRRRQSIVVLRVIR